MRERKGYAPDDGREASNHRVLSLLDSLRIIELVAGVILATVAPNLEFAVADVVQVFALVTFVATFRHVPKLADSSLVIGFGGELLLCLFGLLALFLPLRLGFGLGLFILVRRGNRCRA